MPPLRSLLLCVTAAAMGTDNPTTDNPTTMNPTVAPTRYCPISHPQRVSARHKNYAPLDGSPRPDVVLVLLDDLDLMLGSPEAALPKSHRLLVEKGAEFTNWMAHTPVCCPSRAELLTGRYFHNIKAQSGETTVGACMHVQVSSEAAKSPFYDDWYFAPHLQQQGYTVGMFGKHLNSENTACPAPGVDQWFINDGGDYFSPTFAAAVPGGNPLSVEYTNCSYNGGSCYSTSVIGNQSLAWIERVEANRAEPQTARKPYFAFVAVKAPHIQDGAGWPVALAAPWYNDTFVNATAPRFANWNLSCPDHHWLVRQQPPMTLQQAEKSDLLYRSRLQSLMSVDDLVEELVHKLERLGTLNNTFIFLTSDHGYQFGQFRMPQGKWNVYDTDLRIPLYARGPGVTPGSKLSHLGSNVDIMPTILDIAGASSTPASMDGRSFAPLLQSGPSVGSMEGKSWRTQLLVEYYGLGDVVRYEHLEDSDNNTFRALRVIDLTAPAGERNLKLAEFTNWSNWNFTKPAQEFELFNLESDPSEIHNIYPTAPKGLKTQLHSALENLYRCQGRSCN